MIHVPETVITTVGPEESYSLALLQDRASAHRGGYPLPNDVPGDIVEHMSDRFDNPGAYVLLATVDQKPAGFSLSYPDGIDTEYLSLLMVDPDFQGRGIASKLITIVAERARLRGDQRVTLWTDAKNNGHAQSFYEHRGFAQTAALRPRAGGLQVQYEKWLNA